MLRTVKQSQLYTPYSYFMSETSVKDQVCDYGALLRAAHKCKRGVMWKDSVAGWMKNSLTNCFLLKDEICSGKYKIGKYSVFEITEPKKRTIVSTHFKDRVFQRSLCDNYLTNALSRSFIYDNAACQVGKGTDFARKRLKVHLQKFYRKHELNGYVFKCDIKNYFGSTPHSVAIEAVSAKLDDEWAAGEVARIINSFTQGPDPDVGLGLGSQVTQLIELTVLDHLDHIIKEQLHIKHYVRYMDDFILIHESKEYLRYCMAVIEAELRRLGLQLSAKKTQIFPVKQSIRFLGFSYRLTGTGKVVMKVLSKKVTKARRRLKKQVALCKAGVMSREQVDDCFRSWKAHAVKGDSYMLIRSTKDYYNKLWEE